MKWAPTWHVLWLQTYPLWQWWVIINTSVGPQLVKVENIHRWITKATAFSIISGHTKALDIVCNERLRDYPAVPVWDKHWIWQWFVQVVANNDSVLSKVAYQKWPLDDTPEEKSELTNLLKTLTRQQDSQNQIKLKCKGCKLESAFCNCSLSEIMFENTFQVPQSESIKPWCLGKRVCYAPTCKSICSAMSHLENVW